MSESFREFVVQRSPALSRTAYLLTGDHQLAEDLLQSALARIYRHWRRIRTRTCGRLHCRWPVT